MNEYLGDSMTTFWVTLESILLGAPIKGSITDCWEILTIGYYTVLLMYNPSWPGTHGAN